MSTGLLTRDDLVSLPGKTESSEKSRGIDIFSNRSFKDINVQWCDNDHNFIDVLRFDTSEIKGIPIWSTVGTRKERAEREFEKCNDAERHVLRYRRHRELNFEFRAMFHGQDSLPWTSLTRLKSEKSWLSLVVVEHTAGGTL